MSILEYRAYIDGLRAVAVISVLLFHFDKRLLPGGFVGVDVFFVISGYLIASIIISGIRDGNIDLSVARRHNTKVPKEKFIEYGDVLINSTGVGTLGRISIVGFEPESIQHFPYLLSTDNLC